MDKRVLTFLTKANDAALPHPAAGEPLTTSNLWRRVEAVVRFAGAHAAELDADGVFPEAEFAEIRRAGLLLAPLDEEFGGLGLGIDAAQTRTLLQVLKRFGYANLAVGRIYEGHVNALQLVQTFGTAAQARRFAEDAAREHRIFGVWNAEGPDGVSIEEVTTGWHRVHGAKTFCSGGGFVDRPFVNGKTAHGWQMCIVPMERVQAKHHPDWWQPSGMRATVSYKIDFSGVEVEDDFLIGAADDYHRQPWLTVGVIRFAAVQLGGAEALVDASRKFLASQKRGDDPYQLERMGRMTLLIQSGNLWLNEAAARVAAYHPTTFAGRPEEPTDEAEMARLVTFANMVRTAVEGICMEVTELAERSIGTRGLLPPLPMERIIRDLRLYLRQPGFDAALASVGQQAFRETRLGSA